jgi:phage terminase large subunit
MWEPRPILGAWTPDQKRVAAHLPNRRRLVVPAANGVGKTYLAADLIVSFLLDNPHAAVILTAPTNRQVCELLWPHVTERLLHVGLADQDWIIPTKNPHWEGGDGDSIIGFATNTPMRMQGFHAEHLLVVCDEASGMPTLMVQALEGLAVGEENYVVLIGNPNLAEGAFYEATKQPSYEHEQISALTHPNLLQHAEVVPGATTWISCIDRIRDWCKPVEHETKDTFSVEISDAELQIGESYVRRKMVFLPNDAFRIRYLGRFPSAVAWQLIQWDYINAAMDVIIPGTRPRVAALDVARRGGDRTMYGLREGDTVSKIELITPATLVEQAEEVLQILKRDQPEIFTIDAAGLGIGLIDELNRLLAGERGMAITVHSFQGAGEPLSPSHKKRYANRRMAAFGQLQIAFENHRIAIPRETELADELAAMRFRYTDQGKAIMVDKEVISVTLGRSPDEADMLSLLWESGTDFGWATGIPAPSRQEQPW